MLILTGAAGFIGSHIADFFAPKQRLLLVDEPSFFRERPYFDVGQASLWDWATGQEAKTARHRILDRNYFLQILEKVGRAPDPARRDAKEHILIPSGDQIEAVLHIGACTDTAERRADYLARWNLDYTKAIWNWCARWKVPLIYASSGATYGGGEHGFSDDWESTRLLKPLNPYGQSKQDFDLWAREEALAGRCPPRWYGLKFFNVYGPREAHKGPMASAVLHAYRQISRSGSCRLFRSHNPKVLDGEQSRDFIHVKDIVSLVDHFLARQPESGLYNCGTGKARTFLSMMDAIFRSLERPMKVEWIETPEQYRQAYQYFTEADMRRTLGSGYGGAFLSLEEGVADYVSWLRKHELPEQIFH